MESRPDGSILVEPQMALGPHPDRLTDVLDYWAEQASGRVFLAQRDGSAGWRTINYGVFRKRAIAAAHWLLDSGASSIRPLAILSGNDIEHAILALGAMYAGVPYAPVSPAYSLTESGFTRLRHVFDLLTPGVVFSSDGAQFGSAIRALAPSDAAVLTGREAVESIPAVDGESLPRVDVGDVAKVLFTSGSTGVPKGVITTHRMLASNQEMLRTVYRFLADDPPVICDWLPWHHTFGGSHNFGLVLYNGGTLYIDEGRPVAGAFDRTVECLREIAPTVYFNVPKGYEMLAAHLRRDRVLRDRFFSRLRMMFYAAAGLAQHVWDDLEALSIEACGARIPMMTGLGSTETAPFAMCAGRDNRRAGVVGLPVPGVSLKLAPVENKLEARVKGPNVTPGYWREPELTRGAFDDEGYYRLGDALQFIDPADPGRGFLFDGRIAEDFKLSTGTWVSVGPLRAAILMHFAPYVRDVVIAGEDRDEVTALFFPDPEHAASSNLLASLLRSFAAKNPHSSTRVERAIVLHDPPSMDGGEMTDKGSINQRASLRRRAAEVDRLYTLPYSDGVLSAE